MKIDIYELKKDIQKARSQRDRLEGQKQAALEQLKTEFGCDSLEDARAMHASMTEAVGSKQIELDRDVEAFCERYPELS